MIMLYYTQFLWIDPLWIIHTWAPNKITCWVFNLFAVDPSGPAGGGGFVREVDRSCFVWPTIHRNGPYSHAGISLPESMNTTTGLNHTTWREVQELDPENRRPCELDCSAATTPMHVGIDLFRNRHLKHKTRATTSTHPSVIHSKLCQLSPRK